MPKFTKTEKELTTRFEKWMFVLKNLPKLERIPSKLKEDIFIKLFEAAEISKLSPSEYKKYESSLNAYRDIFNIQSTAFEKGEKKGKMEVAKKGLKEGLHIELIMKLTGLTEEEVNKLKPSCEGF